MMAKHSIESNHERGFIERALNSKMIDLKDRATRLINILGDRGMYEYRELLASYG